MAQRRFTILDHVYALWSSLATRSDCHRGPKPQAHPKWLEEGAKRVLASWRNGLPRVSCTIASLSCTNAAHIHQKTPFAPSPNQFRPILRFRTTVAGTRGRKLATYPLLFHIAQSQKTCINNLRMKHSGRLVGWGRSRGLSQKQRCWDIPFIASVLQDRQLS